MSGCGVGGVKNLGEVESRKVYLWVSKDSVIEADLFDGLYRDTHGKIACDLHIVCPRCNGTLRVDGHKHKIDVEYLDKPRPLVMPDTGETVMQTAVISVEGYRKCPHDAVNGKGLCMWGGYIRDNCVH